MDVFLHTHACALQLALHGSVSCRTCVTCANACPPHSCKPTEYVDDNGKTMRFPARNGDYRALSASYAQDNMMMAFFM